ncbi:hypothetical protein [Psychromonas aquimarina]|uniref:hypothetical protein n=1 Tax=Psychromonas aquimarina TaxID=444919 RepID=UPI0003F51816|nr:hypothetical protein [Psychromonas aquimarina]
MKLDNFEAVKQYFSGNSVPYYFISPTNFNLMDMHRWVNNWLNINSINCYDGLSASTLIPALNSCGVFSSLESINYYLLNHPQSLTLFADHTEKQNGSDKNSARALFLFFNPELQARCTELGIDIQLPDNELVKSIDNKITTTEIGNEAGVASVPNTLANVDSYQTLLTLAESHMLGKNWVVQTPYGDSGKTTFFISSEDDYNKAAEKIEEQDRVKIMKRINCVGTAIEACASRAGTYVGPLLSEMIGFEQLTPYKGGWCGNELYQDAFSDELRKNIHEKTESLGSALYERGYRGYFEADYLIDLDDSCVYLGELNPRITGISAMTNTSPFCQKTIPLFLFHLLEYGCVEAENLISPAQYNQLSLTEGAQGETSQMIIKHTPEQIQKIHNAPVSGVYQLDNNNQLQLLKAGSEVTDKSDNPDHGFIMRIMGADEYAYQGADLAIVFLNTRLTQARGTELNSTAARWLQAVNNAFDIQALSSEEQKLIERYNSPTSSKGGSE